MLVHRLFRLTIDLLVSQRSHWINLCGTACREVASAERYNRQKDGNDSKRRDVELADVRQHDGDQTGDRCSTRQPDNQADNDQPGALSQKESDDVTVLRAQSHADADFVRMLAYNKRHHSVQTDTRQQHRQASNHCCQHRYGLEWSPLERQITVHEEDHDRQL